MNNSTKKFMKWLVFIVYICALVYFMFFAEMLGRTQVGSNFRYNLVPFKEIRRFLVYYHQLGIIAVTANLMGNVIAFMPFGVCLPMVTEHRMKFLSVLIYTVGLSLLIEITQLVSKVGSFDVDDIILNTIGGILGYVLFVIWKAIYERNKK